MEEQEDRSNRYKEQDQFGSEKGTIVKQIVFKHKKIVGLILEREMDGKKINEFVYDKWDSDKKINNEVSVDSEYRRLLSEIEDRAKDELKIRAKSILLRSYCTAYLDEYKYLPKKYFASSYDFVESCRVSTAVEMIKTQILLVLIAMLIAILLILLDCGVKDYVLASFFGLLGSFVSICFNYNKIRVVDFESSSQLCWRYGLKLICGMIFGFIALIFLKAGLINPTLMDNYYFQLTISFVAGFESKWVPRIASAVASGQDK